jgi:DNA-binding IclR family transcriptional regulator
MTSARRSPPTERVIVLLDHFATHPDEKFGLSELARALQLSKPTCLGIVSALTESGYLTVDVATKTYALGPAALRLGKAARTSFSAADVAEGHLAELSRRFDSACTAAAVVGDQVTILASTDVPGREPVAAVGTRYPFAPPVGLMFVTWDEPAAFDRWIARPAGLPVELDPAELREIAAEARDRGYLIEGLTTAGRRLHTLIAGFAQYQLPTEVRELVGQLVSDLGERTYLTGTPAPRERYGVSVLAAPTFNGEGRQELVLSMYIGHTITGAEIARRGTALVEVAEAVTEQVGGIRPRTAAPHRAGQGSSVKKEVRA